MTTTAAATLAQPAPRRFNLTSGTDEGSKSLEMPRDQVNNHLHGRGGAAGSSASDSRPGADWLGRQKSPEAVSPNTRRSQMKKQVSSLFGQGGPRKRSVEGDGAAGMQPSVYEDCGLIDRKKSVLIVYWDLLMLCALLYAATVTPFEVVYVSEGPCITTLFLINRLVDCFFLIDIFVTFNLIERDAKTGHWMFTRKAIARQYLKSWFAIDFIAVLPIWITTWVLSDGAYDCAANTTGFTIVKPEGSGSPAVGAIRMLRLVRLMKLARILKASRIVKRTFELLVNEFELPRAPLKLFSLSAGLLLFTHWQACLWSITSLSVAQDPPGDVAVTTWVGSFISGERDATGGDVTAFDVHVASMYWSFMTLTSIGYGDICALNTTERILSSAYQLISGFVWAYVIGTMASITSSMEADNMAFASRMDRLSTFMRGHNIPKHLRIQIREFFEHAKRVHVIAEDDAILSVMSPMLQARVIARIHGRWLNSIPCLSRTIRANDENDQQFTATLLGRLRVTAYLQSERLPLGRLYVMRKGLGCLRWRVYSVGHAWGADILLDDVELIDHSQLVALTYVETYHLTREDFDEVAELFPEQNARVMRHVRLHLQMQRLLIKAYADRRGIMPSSFAPRSKARGFNYAVGTAREGAISPQKPDQKIMSQLSTLSVKVDRLGSPERLSTTEPPSACPPSAMTTPTDATNQRPPGASPARDLGMQELNQQLRAISVAITAQQAHLNAISERLEATPTVPSPTRSPSGVRVVNRYDEQGKEPEPELDDVGEGVKAKQRGNGKQPGWDA